MTRLDHETPPTRHALPGLLDAIPVLTTPRLVLRAPRLEDFPLLVAIDEDLKDRSQRDGAGTRAASWRDFMQMIAVWVLRGHGWWTVQARDRAVGFIGFGFEPGDREPELGYLLDAPARGQGYATEAARSARDWGWSAGLPSMVSYIAASNTASQNVARKLGAVRDSAAEAALDEPGTHVWRHPTPEAA